VAAHVKLHRPDASYDMQAGEQPPQPAWHVSVMVVRFRIRRSGCRRSARGLRR
jgi:hypothetical protein